MPTISYPRVRIEFCTKCRWNLRAVWYLQELQSTFATEIAEIALAPAGSGKFVVRLQLAESTPEVVVWDRKERNGFPGMDSFDGMENIMKARNFEQHEELWNFRKHPLSLLTRL
jgi:selT/selW/selH-like putative selenoprotein